MPKKILCSAILFFAFFFVAPAYGDTTISVNNITGQETIIVVPYKHENGKLIHCDSPALHVKTAPQNIGQITFCDGEGADPAATVYMYNKKTDRYDIECNSMDGQYYWANLQGIAVLHKPITYGGGCMFRPFT
jgi:hypothetical protein